MASMLGVVTKVTSSMFDTSCSVDNWTFKCFYRVTTAVMVGCSVLVTARQFFGAPIACDAGSVRTGEGGVVQQDLDRKLRLISDLS